MGRKPAPVQIAINPGFFSVGPEAVNPEALNREAVTTSQVDQNEKTIIYGVGDSLPLRIMDAVNKSPTATSCLGRVEEFTRGSKFTDEGLMSMPIDKDGTTLWSLHSQLCPYMSLLEAFSARFTFDSAKKITNTYSMGIEALRFVRPEAEGSTKITQIKHNPYFGTTDYERTKTKCYWMWDPAALPVQLREGSKFMGQVYYEGMVKPPFKFYSVPKYWAAEDSIYVDAGVQVFNKANIDNGFFQSALLQMIGDPTQLSKNPKYMTEVIGTDGIKRMENVNKVTVGQEFSEMMSTRFSGAKKAGTVMALWALTKELTANIQAFPTNTNLDLLEVTENQAVRKICTATQTQAILANLQQSANPLGNGGDAMKWAIELMQSRVSEPQHKLETFYNTIMLPNLQSKTAARVKIVNFRPVQIQVTVDKQVWDWMNDKEKADFVKENYPSVKVDPARDAVAAAPVDPETGEPVPAPAMPTVNEALKSLKVSEINRIKSVSDKYEKGKLTYDQAKQLLQSYGLNDEQITAWLAPPDEV